MNLAISIFQLLAGIGIFLFAMHLLEESLKNISGRNFKIFLQKISKNKLGAVAGGTIVTAALQSSSMVSLMVMAFVGAGVFTMKNALAIILGANLGTTIDSWLVATLGFKTNIEVIAYPALFLGSLLLILFGKRKEIKYISYFIFGFGLLFISLSFMKTGMETQVKTFDFSRYHEMSSVFFLMIGFIITLLVQSSSVTMALTLSAIHTGAINFPSAAAIVLGSEVGTTIKILLSAIGGSASKKRVVLGNLLFNSFLTIFVFAFLNPILFLITDIFNINNPLIGLVTFSSLINLSSIIIFLPFLDLFVKFLERFFKNSGDSAATYINHANVSEPETALDLFRKETVCFIQQSMHFNLEIFSINSKSLNCNSEFKNIKTKQNLFSKTIEEKYENLKRLQGEMQSFYLGLRGKLNESENVELNQLISAVRASMHSVKSITDVESNITNLKRSSKNVKYDFFIYHKKETEDLYQRLNVIIGHESIESFEKLQSIFQDIENRYTISLTDFYQDVQDSPLDNLDMTTAINFNRELFTSNKALVMAIKDLVLNEVQAETFNHLPIYKS